MAINKNHEFEDFDGTRCAVVERNVSPERVAFLKNLLGYNNYKVIVVGSPPPKAAAVAKPMPVADGVTSETVNVPVPPPPPQTFTVGVTDVTFNAINAVFGRLLHARNGQVVTLAYWAQKDPISNEDIPYFENGN
ncbi:MAG: hypothetical protein ABIX01_19145 [Chitinophagaceae bacterium]